MITDAQFHAILELKTTDCVALIIKDLSLSELEASKIFYNSECYKSLENSATNMWHYSPRCIVNMFLEERANGSFDWPEET